MLEEESFDCCDVDVPIDRVLRIRISRESRLNALDRGAHWELDEIFERFGRSRDLRVAIITGTGRAFCVGTDLKDLDEKSPREHYPPSGFAGLTAREGMNKPVIAAVNGLCLGGGVEIVLACDLALAADHARFGLPETRVGLAAVGGAGLARIARDLPRKAASWIALTGDPISARQAVEMHLINESIPGGAVMDRCLEVAESILRGSRSAVEVTKEVMSKSLSAPNVFDAMKWDVPSVQQLFESDDAMEGIAAFKDGRVPNWIDD